MQSFRDDLLLYLNPARLDADLAAGSAPEISPAHLARARRLVTPRARYRLAANWEQLLESPHPSGRMSARVPVRRRQLRCAEAEIRELIEALRATGPVPARGVAMAARLLTDGRGPIYNPNAPDDLAARLQLAIEQLDPALPLVNAG